MWYFKVTPEHPQFDSPHLFAINPQGMLVRDWNQLDIEKGGYMPQVEALIAGGAQARSRRSSFIPASASPLNTSIGSPFSTKEEALECRFLLKSAKCTAIP